MRPRRRIEAIGAFSDVDLIVCGPARIDRYPITPPRTVSEAWDIARRLELRQIWMTKGAVEAIGLPAELDRRAPTNHEFLDSGTIRHPQHQEVLAPWLTYWSDSAERQIVEISFPSWDRYSPFNSCSHFAPDLAGEVGEFNERTGMMWRRNGQTTSDAWLRDNLRGLRTTDAPEPGDNGNLEADLRTVRELEDSERRAKFVHAFDANAMYLGAASSLALPVGRAEHNVDGNIYPVTMPGYWRYGAEWITTPTARFRDAGAAQEFYGWPEWHRFLEGWYKALRDARNELVVFGPSPALDAVKATYRQGIGQLASHRKEHIDPLYQPYWRHAIQAEARTRLERRIRELKVQPLAVDVDCLYVLAGSPDPVFTAMRVGIPLGNGIGEFKVTGTATGAHVRAILKSSRGPEALGALREAVAA